jgi:O-Antigen ligase
MHKTSARILLNMQNSRANASGIAITGQAFLAFTCGAVNDLAINIIGEYYLSEILLIFAAVIVLITKGSNGAFKSRLFWGFLITGWVTFLGYMISDLYVGTEPWQYLKGWGRTIIMIGDCFALMVLTIQNRQNLWWFMLGTGLGGIAYLYFTGVPLYVWKLGYGERATITFLALLMLFPKKLWPAMLIGYGVFNFYLDYRNLGAATIAVGAITIGMNSRRRDKYIKKMIISGSLALLLIMLSLSLTQDEYYVRRQDSVIGRTAGIIVSLYAIADSPLIGYGSWTINEKYANELWKEVAKRRKAVARSDEFSIIHGGKLFSTHSQILQSWIEGGLLGAAFFLFYGYQLVRSTVWGTLRRGIDAFTPVFLFTLIIGLWNLIASPFLGFSRMQIAIAVSVIIAMEFERQKIEANTATAPADKPIAISSDDNRKRRILRTRGQDKTGRNIY